MYCSFVCRSDGLYQCEWCNWVYTLRVDKPPKRHCPSAPSVVEAAERLTEETGDPSIIDKAACYSVALARWTAAGFPMRTDEEVREIYETHCNPRDKPCEDFRNDTCRLCGCPVRPEGMAVRNKIKMATERCRKKKWGKSIAEMD